MNKFRRKLGVYTVLIVMVTTFSMYTVDYAYFEKVPALLPFSMAFIFIMIFLEVVLYVFPICPRCHGFGVFPFDQLTHWQKIKNNALIGAPKQYKTGTPCTRCDGVGWINLHRLWREGQL